MKKEELKQLEYYTDQNAHAIARIYIAKHFDYLKSFEDRFHAINKIHEIDGHLDYHLGLYRNELTHKMLEVIKEREGEEVYLSINQAL